MAVFKHRASDSEEKSFIKIDKIVDQIDDKQDLGGRDFWMRSDIKFFNQTVV